MLVTAKVPRSVSFLVILVPAILVMFFADITVAVNLASRIFAAYFLIQSILAGILARREGAWRTVTFTTLVGIAMATILVFGLPL